MKYINADEAAVTQLEVQTDTADWAASWTGTNGIAKTFNVSAYDDSNAPVSGVAITLIADSGDSVGQLLASPVTNSAGVARCRVLFNSYEIGDGAYPVFAVSGSETITVTTGVLFVDTLLPKVKFLLAADGVIDDNDYASDELIPTLSGEHETIEEKSEGRLYWGQIPVAATALVDNSYFEFDLNGRDDLFQNQLLRYSGLIISGSSNGSYSPVSYVSIERSNGGEGFKYLTGSVTIPEADETGYVNKAMSIFGVTVLIETGDIENDNDEMIISDYLHNSDCTVILTLTGKDEDGNTINHLRYNVTDDPDEIEEHNSDGTITIAVNSIVTTVGTDVGADFFSNLGRGRVYLNLTVTYDQIIYSLREVLVHSYLVDVIPPGV